MCIYSIPKVASLLRRDLKPDPGEAPPKPAGAAPPLRLLPGCPWGWDSMRETSFLSLVKSQRSLVTLSGLTAQGFLSPRMSQALVTSPFNSGTKLFSPLGVHSGLGWKAGLRTGPHSPRCESRLPVGSCAPRSPSPARPCRPRELMDGRSCCLTLFTRTESPLGLQLTHLCRKIFFF